MKKYELELPIPETLATDAKRRRYIRKLRYVWHEGSKIKGTLELVILVNDQLDYYFSRGDLMNTVVDVLVSREIIEDESQLTDIHLGFYTSDYCENMRIQLISLEDDPVPSSWAYGLTPQQQIFIMEYCKTNSNRIAYQRAYNCQNAKQNTIDRNATELKRRFKHKIEHLRSRNMAKFYRELVYR